MSIEEVKAYKDSKGKLYHSANEAFCAEYYRELEQLVIDCTYDDYFHLDDFIDNLRNSPDKAKRISKFFQGLIKES